MKDIAPNVDVFIVVGSKASSNANRLREVAERLGATAYLVDDESGVNRDWFGEDTRIAITAGASTPEHLVKNVVGALAKFGYENVLVAAGETESIEFKLPVRLLS